MIACLNVPYFAAAVEQRNDADLARRPIVVGGRPWEPRPVYSFSREVALQGVKPGMSLRLAHVLSPHSRFIPAAPPQYFSASGEITDALTDFTHLVEPEELWLPDLGMNSQANKTAGGQRLPARYTLDLESLPPAEAFSLAQEIGRYVRQHTSLAPSIGLAEGKFAARVAAALTRPNHARPVPPGEEAHFLAPRTIHFLPLDVDTARRLHLLGIRTLGQLAGLPLSSLHEQFGPEFVPYYYLAQGLTRPVRQAQGKPGAAGGEVDLKNGSSLPVRPLLPEQQESVTLRFDGAVDDRLVLENALARLATQLAGRLQSAGLEGRTLHLAWEPESAPLSQLKLLLRQPTADPQRLATSLHELLHQALGKGAGPSTSLGTGLEQPVSSLAVTITDLSPAAAWQLSLFDPPRATSQAREIIANLIAKHGSDCFYRPVLTKPSLSHPELRRRTNGPEPVEWACPEPVEWGQHPLPERRFQLREAARGYAGLG